MKIVDHNSTQLAHEIKALGRELGFTQIGITDPPLGTELLHLQQWLAADYHGQMAYFKRNLACYLNPQKLMPQVNRIICCRINYPPRTGSYHPIAAFGGYLDYTVAIRQQLHNFVEAIQRKLGRSCRAKVYAGNAPLLEKAFAIKAGLGWLGKNSLTIHPQDGSYCWLGEILLDLAEPLAVDQPITPRCGNCQRCLEVCPTGALIAPYQVDARRCISYLTIELRGAIPIELRPLIGTHIFGCDRCQQICPWNQLAGPRERTIPPWLSESRTQLRSAQLVEWFLWEHEAFQRNCEGLPILRLGYLRWLRNLAVALGNLPPTPAVVAALQQRLNHAEPLVQEHAAWALQHGQSTQSWR